MRVFWGALAAASMMMLATSGAIAESGQALFGEHWYVELKAGAPLPPETSIDVNGAGLGEGTYNEGSGFAGAVAVGTYLAPHWRGELEFSWTHAEDGNVYLGGPKIPHKGDVDIYTTMANALYEFDTGWLIPYVGAGVGFTVIDVDHLGAVGGTFTVNDSDVAFVANVIAGAEYPLNETFSLTGRYTAGFSTKTTFDTTGPGSAGIDVDKDGQFHNFLSVGLKINLN